MREYLEELNKMYGTNVVFSESIDFEKDDAEEIKAKLDAGYSIDSAMQSVLM